ncbi:DNA cytosine methyltransferase [Prevotella melaninogenica]|uniref:DNA cytosine methyltransferase n=1 Tax=Prevotella melaninogenica TaxID=28132 RepID=UPI0018CCA323|nr:DNA cytosine methyltransferase [Prevotella melaninogenica]
MTAKTTKQDMTLMSFPEEITEDGVKIYGETSYENQMAVLSHYLHNVGDKESSERKEEIISAIRSFLKHKHAWGKKSYNDALTDEEVWAVAEQPAQYGLFDDFFKVPFPAPKNPKFTFIDLFAGIGGIRLGFEAAGGKCVFSSEFDEDACTTYKANFGEHPFGDITKIEAAKIPDFDVLLAGFPCQSFSIIGKKEGFKDETRGTLFFEIERILKAKKPRAFMLENVRNLVAHDKGKTFKVIMSHLEALGYTVYAKVLNALDYGCMQKRERIIIVGFLDRVLFTFPEKEINHKTLSDVLEQDVASKYYVKPEIRESRLKRLKDKNYPKPYISHENMAGSITPHPYSSCLRAGASANYILINDERRPTEREMLRLQGFPDTYRIVLPYSKVKKQCGNSVAVPVIKAVAKQMIKALNQYDDEKKRRSKVCLRHTDKEVQSTLV